MIILQLHNIGLGDCLLIVSVLFLHYLFIDIKIYMILWSQIPVRHLKPDVYFMVSIRVMRVMHRRLFHKIFSIPLIITQNFMKQAPVGNVRFSVPEPLYLSMVDSNLLLCESFRRCKVYLLIFLEYASLRPSYCNGTCKHKFGGSCHIYWRSKFLIYGSHKISTFLIWFDPY